MCGISGSGKTRYAKSLAADGYRRISSDQIVWDEYGDLFPTLPAERQRQIYMEVNAKVTQSVEKALQAGERIVVDATMCKRARRDAMVDLCRKAGEEPIIVYLRVPEEILAERLSRRKGSGPDDQIVTIEQLKQYSHNFEPPMPDEHYIIIESK